MLNILWLIFRCGPTWSKEPWMLAMPQFLHLLWTTSRMKCCPGIRFIRILTHSREPVNYEASPRLIFTAPWQKLSCRLIYNLIESYFNNIVTRQFFRAFSEHQILNAEVGTWQPWVFRSSLNSATAFFLQLGPLNSALGQRPNSFPQL